MTETPTTLRPARSILSLYWGSIVLSLTLPWILLVLFEVSAHRRALHDALRHVRLHLFAPGYHYFLVGVLSAAPFAAGAIFLLFHLGWNATLEPARFSRRLAGVWGSLILMFGVSFWTHLSALMYPDAQGALVYAFLPFILLVLIPLGYGAGRLAIFLVSLIRRDEEEPA
jgi:hypothetical protein